MTETRSIFRWRLHWWILAGLLVGILGGLAANIAVGGADPRIAWTVNHITEPIGQLFLRLLLMIVVPLVFASLVSGIAGIGDIRTLGRVGLKSLVYTLIISGISVFIGIGLANTIRPGERVDPETAQALQDRFGGDASKKVEAARAATKDDSPLMQVVKTLVPSNPIAAVASDPPNLLHMMFFALIVGIAITLVPKESAAPVVRGCESLFRICSRVIDIVMLFAPLAVACLVFNSIAQFGLDLLQALSWFILTVLLGLGIHMFVVYSLSIRFLSKISPLLFFDRIRTVMLTAFSTSSSNATLPTTIKVTEANLGVPPQINNFVLTIGATANQNGTALYEGVSVLFLAQLAGLDLSLGQQIMVAYLAILGGVGTAGVPAASIPFIVIVLVTIGVNPGLIAAILGVDRFLDMCRTTLNVTGDITAATYVARSEGRLVVPPQSDNLL